MNSPELIILDVGHGNCALLRDTEGVILFDCPPGNVLPETLHQLGITEIAHVLISHADQDHIAGISQLLLNQELKIHNIHLNSDWLRTTEVWKDVLTALKVARRRSGIKVEAQLTTSTSGRINVGEVSVEVLAPVPEIALSGVGGRDLSGKKLRANSMSAVISLSYGADRVAILAGDLDQVGLNNLRGETEDLQTRVLVFPHHGGRPGSGANGRAFAEQLCSLMRPELVVFSIDRSLHRNPASEVVEGVLTAIPNARIVCTQLSEKCASNLPDSNPDHLNNLPAKGRKTKKCCGGTILVQIGKSTTVLTPVLDSHREFVARFPNSLCRRSFLAPEQTS